MTQGHRVAFVGDGLNDAPVIAKSNLGIAMLHADTAAQTKQNTQVHIAGSSLKSLAFLFPIAKQADKWLKVCLGISLGYNLISILLASGVLLVAGVVINPVIGAVLMVVQLGVLLLGAYFIHRKKMKLPPVDKPAPQSYKQMATQGLDVQASNTMISSPEEVLERGTKAQPPKEEAKIESGLNVNHLSRSAV